MPKTSKKATAQAAPSNPRRHFPVGETRNVVTQTLKVESLRDVPPELARKIKRSNINDLVETGLDHVPEIKVTAPLKQDAMKHFKE